MKYTKTEIGEIGYIPITKEEVTYNEMKEELPEEVRVMEAWEFMKLLDNDFEVFKDIPKNKHYLTKANELYCRACWLNSFDDDSNFIANVSGVDFSDSSLRGVLVVKK